MGYRHHIEKIQEVHNNVFHAGGISEKKKEISMED